MGIAFKKFVEQHTKVIIFGIHSCKAAITSGNRKIRQIFLQEGKPFPSWINNSQKVFRLPEREIKQKLPKGAIYQGIAMDVDESSYYVDISYFKSTPKNCCIAMLDGVVDPHNLGAIIRSASAFGVFGIIFSTKSSCKLNGTVVKTSSGGIEHVPLCVVKNLGFAIESLKEYGYWVVSLSEEGEKYLNDIDLKGKICFVLGAEGEGIRLLQRKKSDYLVKLPTCAAFSTLNVSNAAAISFYEAYRQSEYSHA